MAARKSETSPQMHEIKVERTELHSYLKLQSQKERKAKGRQLPAPKKPFLYLVEAGWRDE